MLQLGKGGLLLEVSEVQLWDHNLLVLLHRRPASLMLGCGLLRLWRPGVPQEFNNRLVGVRRADEDGCGGDQEQESYDGHHRRTEPDGRVFGRQAVVAHPVLFQAGFAAKAVAARSAA
jgi:hypothetical protein